MTRYLLDTSIISNVVKPQPSESLLTWWAKQQEDDLFIASLTLAEVWRGILEKPRGKQDWLEQPHEIWYPRTTGIWQTVWLEVVPPSWISDLRFTPSLARWEIGFEAWLGGERREGLRLSVQLSARGQVKCP